MTTEQFLTLAWLWERATMGALGALGAALGLGAIVVTIVNRIKEWWMEIRKETSDD